MNGGTKTGLTIAVITLGALVCFAEVRSAGVLWLDFDMKNIPEPKVRDSGYYDYFFKGQLVEETKKDLDIPRWIRHATGHPKQAANVNALDEVPDSSWYTNRHRLHRMTIEELVRGPNRGAPPDLTHTVITKAKTEGASPGAWIKDAHGTVYLLKFDLSNYPNLQSGAEVASTKLLYAAGYNVPENYVAYLDPKGIEIGKDAAITDSKTGKKRPLTRDDIDEMLRHVARAPDGGYRLLASKVIPGKLKGPFAQLGFRDDDPNDLIPHENRRELRALWLLMSWINGWDLKEGQSMDAYVEEDGRKFLRHYLLDFGSTFGADTDPTEYFHGHVYGLDSKDIMKQVFSLGIRQSPYEKRARIISPEIGNFTADGFDPARWRPTYPAIMFDNMTPQDAFWATRIILSFTESDLRTIIETGEYSEAYTIDYLLRTLLERRQILARHRLSKVDGLSEFSLQPTDGGVALRFHDLMVDHHLGYAGSTEYAYEIKGAKYRSAKMKTARPEVRIDRDVLSAALEHGSRGAPLEITIWSVRQNSASDPVRIYFDWNPAREGGAIRRIARG